MSLQHIQKNSPRLLPKPAKFEKNPPNGYRVIRKTKCRAGGAAGAGGAGISPIHKQASLAGRLIRLYCSEWCPCNGSSALAQKLPDFTNAFKNVQDIKDEGINWNTINSNCILVLFPIKKKVVRTSKKVAFHTRALSLMATELFGINSPISQTISKHLAVGRSPIQSC